MKNRIIIFIIIAVSIGAAFLLFPKKETKDDADILSEEKNNNVLVKDGKDIRRDGINDNEKKKPISAEKEDNFQRSAVLPDKIKIEVPFTSQAPYGVWDERHDDACEEASLLMVVKYLDNDKLTPEIAEKELQSVIDYQIEKYGDYKDSDMEELVQIAEGFYSVSNLEVIYDFKKERIKEELAKGNPIIVPTAGRLLGNPYYTPPGPLYHNLVLVGYEGDNVITNDPGTKRGEGYIYDIDVLYNAIHDFPGKKEDIEDGRKAMIIIEHGA